VTIISTAAVKRDKFWGNGLFWTARPSKTNWARQLLEKASTMQSQGGALFLKSDRIIQINRIAETPRKIATFSSWTRFLHFQGRTESQGVGIFIRADLGGHPVVRTFVLGLLALTASTSSFAQSNSPLPPGKPAGVHEAMARSTENALLIGMSVVGLGIGIVWAMHAKGSSSTTSTTSTSP
jgi:hypothetical protein